MPWNPPAVRRLIFAIFLGMVFLGAPARFASAADPPKIVAATLPVELPAIGESVEVKDGARWLRATVEKIEGGKVLVLYEDGFERSLAPQDVRRSPQAIAASRAAATAPTAAAGFSPAIGDRIEVKDTHTWRASKVLKRQAEKAFIHYEGWSDAWDEWVGPDRMRPLGSKIEPAAIAVAGAGSSDKTPVAEVPTGDRFGMIELKSDGEVAWAAKADPGPKPPQILATRAIPLPVKRIDSEKVERFIFTDPKTPIAALVLYVEPWFDKPSKCRVLRVDLTTGRPLDTLQLPPRTLMLDLNSDGKMALCRTSQSKWHCLELLQVEGATTKRLALWRPHDGENEISMAAFVDDGHVVSCDKDGYLILWEILPNPKALYRLKIGNSMKPVLSPGRKTFVAEAFGKLRLFDTFTGKPLGTLQDDRGLRGGTTLAFSQDGQFLSLWGWARAEVFTVADGKRVRQIQMPVRMKPGDSGASWLPTGHLLVNKRYLVDPDKRIVSWEYAFPGGPVVPYAGRLWFVEGAGEESKGLSLGSVVLPHDGAIKAGSEIKTEDLLLFRRGMSVSIDIQTDAPPETREKIVKSLEKQVAAMGLTVADGQPLRLVASTTTGETREVNYRNFRGGPEQKVSVTEKIHKLAVMLDNKEAWATSTRSGESMMLTTKAGQSLDEALREAQDRSYSWLAGQSLPTELMRPGAYKIPGISRVTTAGLKAVEPADTGK